MDIFQNEFTRFTKIGLPSLKRWNYHLLKPMTLQPQLIAAAANEY